MSKLGPDAAYLLIVVGAFLSFFCIVGWTIWQGRKTPLVTAAVFVIAVLMVLIGQFLLVPLIQNWPDRWLPSEMRVPFYVLFALCGPGALIVGSFGSWLMRRDHKFLGVLLLFLGFAMIFGGLVLYEKTKPLLGL
jgi:uncharacterized membrane protein